jgi:VWFA-related protein
MSVIKCASVATLAFNLFLLSAVSSLAQQAAATSGGAEKIQLDVDVTTMKGQPAGELAEKDFTVLDNKTQRPISSFTAVAGKEAPVEVVIVVDSVNTPYINLSYQREQIAKYLRTNDGVLPYSTTFAVLTDTDFRLYNGITKNGMELADALDKTDIGLRTINRSQGFYGASDRLTISLNGLRQLTAIEAKRPGRKLVLWVSPGWPLLSGPRVEMDGKQQKQVFQNVIAYSTEMRKANMTLYSVNSWGANESLSQAFYFESFVAGLKKQGDAQLGDLALQVLATQSGGLVLNSSDVIGMMKQCVADGDSYYRITFEQPPADKPDEYHEIQVKMAEGGLVARTRQGYYTQP